MNAVRAKAWQHYHATGERDLLVRAYQDSIRYIAWARYPSQAEDMAQVGLLGLLKAIDRLDLTRVKSIDAWVFLNVRSMMFNVRQAQKTVSLDQLDVADRDDPFADLAVLDLLRRHLNEREADIITRVHLDDHPRTQIAKDYGLTSMRIGQIEKAGLKKLRLVVAA